ncbi:hypothetical protein JCM33374_g4183 [Metschnikowia sp. JCM 33374]|nr:hypothetical protein JCM33374_g4183 [Metschnikowia sp. JCM 33374]
MMKSSKFNSCTSHTRATGMFMKFDSKGDRGTQGSDSHVGPPAPNNRSAQEAFLAGEDAKNQPSESQISKTSIDNGVPQVGEHGQNQSSQGVNSAPPENAPLIVLSSFTGGIKNEGDTLVMGTSRGRANIKSKTGCLTCKYRKKKCDETKPVCRDCRRFNKECVWVDHRTMNGEEIERLKTRVRDQESGRKMRKRVRISRSNLGKEPPEFFSPSRSPELPLDTDVMSLNHPLGPPNSSYIPHQLSVPRGASLSSKSFAPLHSEIRDSPNFIPLNQQGGSALRPTPQMDTNMRASPENNLSAFSPTLLPNFPHIPDIPIPEIPPNMPLGSTDGSPHPQEALSPFEPLSQPRSPAAVLNFLKELSSFNWNPQEQSPSHIEDLSEDQNHHHAGVSPKSEGGGSSGISMPSFNIPTFIEQMQTISHDFPAQFNNLASSFNATFSPSPRTSLSVLPELDQSGFHLYNYYSDVLSQKMCIAPNSQNESNSYQRVFLPLAQKDKGVLYGILAWAGFHLGGQWMVEGTKYAELALKHLCEDISFNQGSQTIEDRRVIINKLAAILIMCGAEICRGDVKFWSVYLQWGWKLLRDNGGILNFNNNKEEHWLISNFAYHDLLASSTSDRGTYFPNDIYDQIFLDPGGISSGNLNPLLGISKPLYKVIGDISSLFFESKQIISDYYNRPRGGLKVGEIYVVSPEDDGSVQSFTDTNTEVSDHTKVAHLLNFINSKAHDLEVTLNTVKPNSRDLESLSDSELELQLTTFEAFQLSCKLYLRQAILKLNPSALECQILMNDLVKCLDILIDSPMQATLVFPTFIAGLFTVTDSGKAAMRTRFQTLITHYGPWNVVRVKSLVEKIWEENPHGDSVVDWNAILNRLNWDLNFA